MVVVFVAVAACGRVGFDPPDTLGIEPASARTNLNTRTAFTAVGGLPPYTFAISAGTGDIDVATGVFHAPEFPGAATIQVTDGTAATAVAQVSFGGDYLYYMGGFDTTAHAEVWRSTDGIAWQVIGQIPQARSFGVVFGRPPSNAAGNAPCSVHAEPSSVDMLSLG